MNEYVTNWYDEDTKFNFEFKVDPDGNLRITEKAPEPTDADRRRALSWLMPAKP